MADDRESRQAAGADQAGGETSASPAEQTSSADQASTAGQPGTKEQSIDPPAPKKGKLITDAVSDVKIPQHNALPQGGWLKSPATFEFLAEGEEAVTALATPDQLRNGQLVKVRVAGYVQDTNVYIWATHPLDPGGLEIRRTADRTWISLRKLFARMQVTRPKGVTQRFDLVPADQDSPHQPALMIDLKVPRGTKHFATSRSSSTAKKKQEKAAEMDEPEFE